MRRLLLLSAALATTAAAQPAPRTVTVSGEGVVSVAPDRAVIRLGVQTRASTAAGALREHEQDVAAVLARVRSFGVPDRDIEIAALQLGEDYGRDGPTGYRATRVVAVTLDSLRAVPELVATVVESGANRLDGIDYTLRSAERYRLEALDRAVAQARAEAERLAAAGARVGPVLWIQEGDVQTVQPPVPARMREGGAPAAAPPAPQPGAYSAGSSQVRARVVVQYELVVE